MLENTSTVISLSDVIQPRVLDRRGRLAEAFRSARFFPHVVIDNFFYDELCRGLVDEFPSFRPENAIDELGKVGQKAYREDVRRLGKTFRRLDDCLRSAGFLKLMSEITSIDELIYDPDYAGGGTHENVDGAQLDTHVDFNYHPNMMWHRRLNLIVFLNLEWQESWGGCFEVHSDPWSPDRDEFETVAPILNRAVIFETSENSWHGFNKIALPSDKKHLTRKSYALYLYTADRPTDQLAPSHATIYVPTPVPERFFQDQPLSPDDSRHLRAAITRRDEQIQFLYQREKDLSGRLEKLAAIVRQRLPIMGYVRQVGEAKGLWEDQWIGELLEFRILAAQPVERLVLEGFVPDFLPPSRRLTLTIGEAGFEHEIGVGRFRWELEAAVEAGREIDVSVVCSVTWNPHRAGASSDSRELAYLLSGITFY